MINTDSSQDLHKVEALLFAASRFMPLNEISKTADLSEDQSLEAIESLKQKYSEPGTALTLVEEGKSWKLGVKDEFLPLMQKVVKTTEFEKPLMETLAVVAWRYPALQCDIIKIRHNKAYDHLSELEERGFISRTKYGRTRKISLTQKFFDYFDLPSREQAQEAFRQIIPQEVQEQVKETERQIEESEKIIEETKKVEAKEGEEENKEVDLVDEKGKPHKLEEYEEKKEEKVEIYDADSEDPSQLKTYDSTEETPKETGSGEEAKTEEYEKEETTEEGQEETEVPEEKQESTKEETPKPEPKEPTKEEKVEERIEEMLHPNEDTGEKEESAEEPKEEQPEEEK